VQEKYTQNPKDIFTAQKEAGKTAERKETTARGEKQGNLKVAQTREEQLKMVKNKVEPAIKDLDEIQKNNISGIDVRKVANLAKRATNGDGEATIYLHKEVNDSLNAVNKEIEIAKRENDIKRLEQLERIKKDLLALKEILPDLYRINIFGGQNLQAVSEEKFRQFCELYLFPKYLEREYLAKKDTERILDGIQRIDKNVIEASISFMKGGLTEEQKKFISENKLYSWFVMRCNSDNPLETLYSAGLTKIDPKSIPVRQA
jgi:hypothetical protein